MKAIVIIDFVLHKHHQKVNELFNFECIRKKNLQIVFINLIDSMLYDAITKLYLNISFYIIFMKYYPCHTLFQNWIEKFKAYEKNLLQWVTKRNITLISVLIQLLLNGETSDVISMPCNLRNFPCDFVYLFFCFNLKEPRLLLSTSSLINLI